MDEMGDSSSSAQTLLGLLRRGCLGCQKDPFRAYPFPKAYVFVKRGNGMGMETGDSSPSHLDPPRLLGGGGWDARSEGRETPPHRARNRRPRKALMDSRGSSPCSGPLA